MKPLTNGASNKRNIQNEDEESKIIISFILLLSVGRYHATTLPHPYTGSIFREYSESIGFMTLISILIQSKKIRYIIICIK